MSSRRKMPFEYRNHEEFHEKLVEWIGDILYDFLPEHGYEVRDEQIYTAFQIADGICENKVHLAEAGLGTGKTFAYLLSAIPYARYTKKPVIIACATSALQEQLASEQGDINTLSKLLDLNVDARMAKDPSQYICDIKVEDGVGELEDFTTEVRDWINHTKIGVRSELPTISDRLWKMISWDENMGCETCQSRGYCKLVKAKEYYRPTKDLIIVDHETFFHDLWTREERILEGKLPILPAYSAVIFDEGHKIMLPATMQAGNHINEEEIDAIISSFEEIQGARESLENVIVALEDSKMAFFEELNRSLVKEGSSERHQVRFGKKLFQTALQLKKVLNHLLLEMQIDQELYFDVLPPILIQAYEGQIERATVALSRFLKNCGEDVICWVSDLDQSFWVVPKNMRELLNKHLFSKHKPVIFTSATLSNEGDFSYIERTMGLERASRSTIGSPFDIKNQVTVLMPDTKTELDHGKKVKQLVQMLLENGGRALVLTNTYEELSNIKESIDTTKLPFDILWEDEADKGYLVRRFKEDETSVLVGTNFWEGIDVPGDSLTLVVIWSLPFPQLDPMIESRKKDAISQGFNPSTAVDFPEMGLKLKQGCGRLIRSENDHGKIVILDHVKGLPFEQYVNGSLPDDAKIVIY